MTIFILAAVTKPPVEAASLLFSWYTAHFGSYNKTYGSLGAAVGFMTWIWISTMVILIGAKARTSEGRARAKL
jgi:YihY family inner membrane protein